MDIQFKKVSYIYQPNTPFSHQALHEIDLTIKSGEFIAIVGHTGSGKSTLLQHLNGLIYPATGEVRIGEYVLNDENRKQDLKELRQKVGLVFQYPEHQLFEETVEKDIAFGPRNFGVPDKLIDQRIKQVIEEVGLNEEILSKSPFELSGGQMRRVAIAGILAAMPEVLVLDEPTAGLDPYGQQQMMALFYRLHKERKLTTILVTHKMEDAFTYADRIVVLEKGNKILEGTPVDIFRDRRFLHNVRLELPEILLFLEKFNDTFPFTIEYKGQTVEEIAVEIDQKLKEIKGQ
ncbi:energy-coupling factor transport system ATP-binding protein [Gracilibacillus ureilyticus]|uniref:Energy-coupling factor transporter ATP-binding protein EcfA2 n=1 Tax=Gracilibacillus ureilyticus TaxID=531814 RepID=A0A1H9VGD9_9BACI|nr:energy-coupling factor ABC transporter ATP-binding protein [Gracilibacillus ureilyticus]SES20534.1 energy-coupling factor transport system ATP-binding protein [Gracilibacillus ureilyticus]